MLSAIMACNPAPVNEIRRNAGAASSALLAIFAILDQHCNERYDDYV